MANPVCLAVHHGLCITAYGAINPCCASRDFVHINDVDDIRDYFYKDSKLEEARQVELTDEWLQECLGCKIKEEKGLVTRKNKFAHWYRNVDEQFTKDNKYTILHMDISFGNSCNQKCIMCNSNFSSQWLKDDIKMVEEAPFIRTKDDIMLKNWSLSYKHLDQIADLVSEHTQKIEIKGGEPLYDKRFQYFVDAVLERNPEVTINTNTNGTYFTDENIEMLNKIKKLNIDVSIDGTGKIFEWIRNYDFETVERNFAKAVREINHTVNANFTTMSYNVDHFETFYNWVGDIAQKYNKRVPCYFTQVVQSPYHISPAFAEKSRIQSGIEQLERIIEDPRGFAKNSIYRDRINYLIRFLEKEIEKDITKDKEYAEKTHQYMTKVRGWDIRDYANV